MIQNKRKKEKIINPTFMYFIEKRPENKLEQYGREKFLQLFY